jgi:hypothetical protein
VGKPGKELSIKVIKILPKTYIMILKMRRKARMSEIQVIRMRRISILSMKTAVRVISASNTISLLLVIIILSRTSLTVLMHQLPATH